nr:ATP-binding protein [Austwickia chelonae]
MNSSRRSSEQYAPGTWLCPAKSSGTRRMRNLPVVEMTVWLCLALLGGLVAGAIIGARVVSGRCGGASGQSSDGADPSTSGVADVLRVLRSSAVVLDAGDAVVIASPAALALGLIRGRDLAHAELRDLVRAVRREGVIRESALELARGPMGQGTLLVQARVAPLKQDQVLLLVEDHTQAQRVETVRRDFVANVSHELKTPVGGISLLAEAVLDARDDAEAVSRFARRIQVESSRLSRLVQEIVDLSRLQASDSLSDPVLVNVAVVAREASERIMTLAEAKQMNVVIASDPDVWVYGDAHMLGTAVDNLLTNAVNYSGNSTRVALGVRRVGAVVEIMVSDQGQGIPVAEQDRIFERFYRVDPARSRATGGTGLGLAIVKHICTNHGGEVKVWSEEGRGSTFTMRLPAAAQGVGVTGSSDAGETPSMQVNSPTDGACARSENEAFIQDSSRSPRSAER